MFFVKDFDSNATIKILTIKYFKKRNGGCRQEWLLGHERLIGSEGNHRKQA